VVAKEKLKLASNLLPLSACPFDTELPFHKLQSIHLFS